MKKVPIHVLKENLASVISEAEEGIDILITRHNRPIARLSRATAAAVHPGRRFGAADLKPALHKKTGGRYLRFLKEDRRSGRD